eukprot:TRINITY_DN1886_c0_g1_i1.p1 TRINITY_DN1886_c0_g1~~TRINITY_DN1886_c0_g1_i1.p1  ORF type:complete len:973 (+),score=217.01 TRINITY_DN1886_c0_g1_i1:67-2985(+)
MKFGRLLREQCAQLPDFAPHFMEYSVMKHSLKRVSFSAPGELDVMFAQQFDAQLDKVSQFSQGKKRELLNRTARVIRQLHSKGDTESLLQLEQELDSINAGVVNLDSYNRLNAMAFNKICKKHDKLLHSTTIPFAMARVRKEAFCDMKLDGFFVALSDAYQQLRAIREGADAAAPWVPPQSFARSTTKYWVENSAVAHLKSVIIKHLPILVFGRKGSIASKAPDLTQENKILECDDHESISSVYLDNDDLLSYHTRMTTEEGARLFRVRWYGKLDYEKPAEHETFLERKTHHESWAVEDSVKQRFQFKFKQVPAYLNGAWNARSHFEKLVQRGKMTVKNAQDACDLAEEAQRQIMADAMVPMVRTAYDRTAFQLSSSNEVRISLDTKMVLSNERLTFRDGEWCMRPEDVPADQRIEFPFSILEIKLQGETPAWVADLLAQPYITAVKKFSKYLTACALFHTDRIRMRPHWFHEDTIQLLQPSERTAVTLANLSDDLGGGPLRLPPSLTRNESSAALNMFAYHPSGLRIEPVPADGVSTPVQAVPLLDLSQAANAPGMQNITPPASQRSTPRGMAPAPPNNPKLAPALASIKKHQPMKIEPKTYFANERTFMNWLNMVVILVSLGAGLLAMSSTEGRISGITLACVGGIIAMYALTQFHWRAHKIRIRDAAGYDDRFGPTVLVLLLVAAILVNILLIAYISQRPVPVATVVDNGAQCQRIAAQVPPLSQPTGLIWHPRLANYVVAAQYGFFLMRTDGTRPRSVSTPNYLINSVAIIDPADSLIFLGATSLSGTFILAYDLDTSAVATAYDITAAIPRGQMRAMAWVPDINSADGGYFFVADQSNVLTKLLVPVASAGTLQVVGQSMIGVLASPTPLTGTNGTVSSLFYDATHSHLYALMDSAQTLLIVNAATGATVGTWPLPGTKQGWTGVAPVATSAAGPTELALVKSTPPYAWRFQTSASGFAPACARVMV